MNISLIIPLSINSLFFDTDWKTVDYGIIQPEYLASSIGMSILWLIVTLIIVGIIFVLYSKCVFVKKFFEFLTNKSLKWLAAFVWTIGFATYCVGAHVPVDNHYLDVVPMAIIHATEMFVFGSDISAIHDDCHNSAWFMTLFNVAHISAAILSLVFVINLFGRQLIARIRLWMAARWLEQDTDRDLYVFWGINDATYNLAKDIKNNNRALMTDIVFVRTFDNSDYDESKFGFGRFFDFVNMKSEELKRLNDFEGCYITSSKRRLTKLEMANDTSIHRILQDDMHLDSFVKLMEKHQEGKIHIFFIDDDQDRNIKATINLLNDEYVKKHNVHIYCNARKCAKTHWMECYEYTHRTDDTHVHIIDTSYLSVMMLKSHIEYHPVQHIEINPETGLTESPFNSLIIGFGGTGIEAVKFLYEFGTFIKYDGTRSDFHCTVIDENMDNIDGFFEVHAPALKDGGEIELYSCRLNGSAYWDKISSILPDLNYVIISLGNADKALEAIAELCAMAIKLRHSNKKLAIYVRSYSKENEAHLNTLCKDINLRYEKHGIIVNIFGSKEDLFTYEYVVDDNIIKEAKKYNYVYEKRTSCKNANPDELEEVWEKVLGIKQKNKDTNELYYPANYTIDNLNEIERKREQNVSNSLHSKTKNFVLNKCGGLNPNDIIKENLSIMEHERWVAKMRITGWQQRLKSQSVTNEQAISAKLHYDVCPWNQMRNWDKKEQDEYHEYDRNVIKATIEFNKE